MGVYRSSELTPDSCRAISPVMSVSNNQRAWFPFTPHEVQLALAIFGFFAAALGFVGVPAEVLAWLAAGYLVAIYLAALLVRARQASSQLQFIEDGGTEGRGYIQYFRSTKKSLFLMHVDDDPPCEELLAVYRDLLDKGIQIRRAVFIRPDAHPEGHAWVERFGDHKNLRQRFVRDKEAAMTRKSFAVVDESTVLIAVPGYEAIDDESYSGKLTLRHLLVVRDGKVAAAFLRLHEQLWQRANVERRRDSKE